MKPADLVARKYEIRRAAARRWKDKAGEVASTAEKLVRGGPMAAASPERAARFLARETVKARLRYHGVGFERIIGDTIDLEDTAPTPAAREAGRPVARIVELLDTNRIGDGFATGFLIAADLLATNWHVFGAAAEASGCGAQLGFERNESGLIEPGAVFELDPDRFFVSDSQLDIAIVAVKRAAVIGAGALNAGAVRLIPTLGKILVGHPVSIIQHPDGRHKHWAVQQNKLLVEPAEADLFLTYATDTLPGSSGSPAFNHDWELVAVHHSGVPRMVNGEIMTRRDTAWQPGMPDSEIDWVANEGARVSKIHAYLQGLRLPAPAAQSQLAALLSESKDPLTSPEVSLPSAAIMERSSAPMNVVINGTANFYLGGADGRAPVVVQPLAAAPPAPGALEKKLRFDPDYADRRGYKSDFLEGLEVPAPAAPADELLKSDGEPLVLNYHHYSLVMHRKRRLAMWAASNVDYDPAKRWRSRDEFGTDTWKPDPRIAIEAQIEDLEFYAPAAKFDRGHVVRRDDVAWGKTQQEEEFGNSDSFHWTNCTPQHEGFNRDAFGYKGLWGGLENHIAQQAGFVKNRITLFAGPILAGDDPSRDFGSGIEVKVPIAFWKVVVVVEDTQPKQRLRAYGFILDQTDAIQQYGWEARFRAGRFREYQVSLGEITARSRVRFHDLVLAADPLKDVAHESRRRPLNDLNDVRLR